MHHDGRLRLSLFLLRLGVFVVMIMWTIDKFLNPDHTAGVFSHFYFINDLSETASFVIGVLQLVIVLAFFLGLKKTLSYGLVLILHAVSTFSSFAMYMDPWAPRNLLFFAAWPMLSACMALFLLREQDTLLTFRSAEKKMFT